MQTLWVDMSLKYKINGYLAVHTFDTTNNSLPRNNYLSVIFSVVTTIPTTPLASLAAPVNEAS